MPWKTSSVMEERLRFVARLLDGEAMTEVCRDFGISRKTGYKIFDRYKEHGLEALSDRSRRPVRYANQLPAQIEALIVRLKAEMSIGVQILGVNIAGRMTQGHFEAHNQPSAIARLAELLCRASGRRSGAWKHIMTTPAPQCRAVRRGQSAACSRRFPNSTQSRGQLFLS